MAAVLAALALVGSWVLFPGRPLVFACILIYLIKEVLYTAALKHVVIVDILVNSIGFPLRAVAGVLAIRMGEYADIEITPWFLMCIFFVSLFIAVCKRRHELLLLEHAAGTHRRVLDDYSPALLDQLVSICTSATIICYALYTILGAPNGGDMLNPMIWTLPFVIFGIFRYLYLVYRREEGGAPEQTLLHDAWLIATVLGWLALSIWVFLGRS
jgi:4-hydroxybenzoate polyprenyltransferase